MEKIGININRCQIKDKYSYSSRLKDKRKIKSNKMKLKIALKNNDYIELVFFRFMQISVTFLKIHFYCLLIHCFSDGKYIQIHTNREKCKYKLDVFLAIFRETLFKENKVFLTHHFCFELFVFFTNFFWKSLK